MTARLCISCEHPTTAGRLEPIPGHGMQWLCVNPTECRTRAEKKGIWKRDR
jgi:hypothetical protein